MNNKKRIIILGAGTAGTMTAHKLAKPAKKLGFEVLVVDQDDVHYYQPGFLFYPFGKYEKKDIIHSRRKYLPGNIKYLQSRISLIDWQNNQVILEKDSQKLDYAILVIATGSQLAPEETPGMKGKLWQKSIFDFYSFEGAAALREKLADFKGGKVVVHITEMPIKCPVAPLEFSFLADAFFKERGIRNKVEMAYVTPLDGAFTKPKAASALGYLLKEKNIKQIADFNVERIDEDAKKLVSYDEREVEFDLLVTVPTNMGDPAIEKSGLGDELRFVPTDPHTLQAKEHENIFVIGDATDAPASKAGSVAHFEVDTLVNNVEHFLKGEPLEGSFDGHANCFVETGQNKGLLIDFNYEIEPLEGKFPFAVVGPLRLLKESRLNHYGKLAFRWIYWHILMRGRPMVGIPDRLSMSGKKR